MTIESIEIRNNRAKVVTVLDPKIGTVYIAWVQFQGDSHIQVGIPEGAIEQKLSPFEITLVTEMLLGKPINLGEPIGNGEVTGFYRWTAYPIQVQ